MNIKYLIEVEVTTPHGPDDEKAKVIGLSLAEGAAANLDVDSSMTVTAMSAEFTRSIDCIDNPVTVPEHDING